MLYVATCDRLLGHKDPKAVLRQAFLLLQEEFLNSPEFEADMSGSTALVALIQGRQLYIANAGDSMAVMSRKGKKAQALNKMHLAADSDERENIEGRGGTVKLTADGKLRTNGVIQLSRAIGYPYLSTNHRVSVCVCVF